MAPYGYNIYGGGSTDVILGSFGGAGDKIYGEDGNDVIFGAGGRDTLSGDSGSDLVVAGILPTFDLSDLQAYEGYHYVKQNFLSLFKQSISNGDGFIYYSNKHCDDVDNSTLYGGMGDDTLLSGGAHDILYGGSGNDLLIGGDGNDILYGDGKNEDEGSDIFDGGNDTLYAGVGNDTLYGGIGDDILLGEAGNDSLNGDAGHDALDGSEGNDVLNGGAGNDSLYGGIGNDALDGGANDDLLVGGVGNDSLIGGAGDDMLAGGAGADSINGGDGFDIASYGDSTSGVILNLGYRDEDIGDAIGDAFENIEAWEGSNFNDTLFGANGNETFLGGTGDDFLYGGAGTDTLYGGVGNDMYVFNTTSYVDNIVEYAGQGADTVYVTPDVTGLSLAQNGTDLLLYANGGQSVSILTQWFTTHSVENIYLQAENQFYSIAALVDSILGAGASTSQSQNLRASNHVGMTAASLLVDAAASAIEIDFSNIQSIEVAGINLSNQCLTLA